MRVIVLVFLLAASHRVFSEDADGEGQDCRRTDQSLESVYRRDAEAARKMVLGCWMEERWERGGIVVDDATQLNCMAILGDRIEFWGRRGELSVHEVQARLVVDAAADPMRLDWFSDDHGDVSAAAGIFRFDGDRLVYVVKGWRSLDRVPESLDALPDRPTEFQSTKDNGCTLRVFRRCEYLEQD